MTKRILLLSNDNKIGDAIVMTGLLKPLRAHWPDCEIGVLCGTSNVVLYQNHPDVKWLHVSASRNVFACLWASLKARVVGYDMVVHFGLDLASRSVQMMLNTIHAKQRFLFLKHPTQPLSNDVVMEGDWGDNPNSQAQHYSARHLRFLQTLGITSAPYAYDIHLEQNTLTTRTQDEGLLMVINSQSSTDNRSLSLAWIRDFVNLVNKQHPHIRIQLLSANAAHEAAQKKIFADLSAYVIVTKSHPSVSHSLRVIQAADIVLSPDTYAVHAASAWNIPVIGLYEPSSSTMDLWRPLSDKQVQICAPAGKTVSDIGVSEVMKALDHLLTTSTSRERVFLN